MYFYHYFYTHRRAQVGCFRVEFFFSFAIQQILRTRFLQIVKPWKCSVAVFTTPAPCRRDRLRKKKKTARACGGGKTFYFFIKNVVKKFVRCARLPSDWVVPSGAETRGIDWNHRDLSIGEVSAQMDATNKSYGRFKLDPQKSRDKYKKVPRLHPRIRLLRVRCV